MQPKFVLYFYDRNPGAPYLIKEFATTNGETAYRPYYSYKHLEDALEALARLSAQPVIVAFTQETVE